MLPSHPNTRLAPILRRFHSDPEWARCIVHWERLPAQPAAYAPIPAGLDARLVAALRQRDIMQLYTHQSEAIAAAQRGDDLVVVTPTASGKTLAYNLPVLDALLREPGARALYLYPTKALAQDQRHELLTLIQQAKLPLKAELYDGDTPASQRRAIRAGADIVLTNPDMLHTGILPHHTQWLSLWTNLRAIVIDEVHHYRGLFGSHFANLLRRMRRIARFYQQGREPQILAASATIANPGELVERLTDAERPVTVIDESGAPQAAKHFIFWNPPPVNEALGLRRSALLEARRLDAALLANDVQSITFTRSRLATELLLRYLQEDGGRLELPPESVRGYRSGYLAAERRDIEQGLRAGAVRAVVSTNALELGIDIGQLDACVMLGYPGSIASTWQQAGRAGRRSSNSLAMLVATSDPLDQFIVRHPSWFFGASPEHARINPDNLAILVDHLRCALFELPIASDEPFGSVSAEGVASVMGYLAEQGIAHEANGTWYWTAEEYPAQGLSLRSIGPETILITEQPGGRVIGEVDRFAVHQMSFPGAIYMHEGRQFLIESLDLEEGRANAVPTQADYYTRAETKRSVAVSSVAAQDERGRAWGEVVVTSIATGYKKIKLHTHETLGRFDLSLPESQMHTTAYWLTFPDVALDPAHQDYGPNWPAQRLAARAREGFRCAHCRISEGELGRELDVHHRTPFREFGYVAGENEAYLAANDLDNLVALCPTCHKREEPWYRSEAALGLQGVAHALGNIAPLFLMCDARDVGLSSELRPSAQSAPMLFLYDAVPGGVGFAEQLYALHDELLAATMSLIRDCPCDAGCPACVGPEAMAGGGKAAALAMLEGLKQ